MTLTIDQLRVWLEQREREASEATESRRLIYHAAKGTPHERRRWTAYIILGARHSLYRELLAAIENERLPDA